MLSKEDVASVCFLWKSVSVVQRCYAAKILEKLVRFGLYRVLGIN
jgi:hypothetical protein